MTAETSREPRHPSSLTAYVNEKKREYLDQIRELTSQISDLKRKRRDLEKELFSAKKRTLTETEFRKHFHSTQIPQVTADDVRRKLVYTSKWTAVTFNNVSLQTNRDEESVITNVKFDGSVHRIAFTATVTVRQNNEKVTNALPRITYLNFQPNIPVSQAVSNSIARYNKAKLLSKSIEKLRRYAAKMKTP